MIDEPLERLRTAARRTRELALDRAGTGLGHEDADDDVGTIGTDGALGFDPFPLLEALHRHGVRAVVIGQVAGIMHGSTELTGDLDLLWDGVPAHAPALAAAFTSVDAQLADETGNPVATHPDSFLRPKVQFTSPGAGGDCCTPALPWGNLHVRECLDHAITAVDPGGLEVHYVSRQDLIRMRRALGRPKDLRRADELDSLTSDSAEDRSTSGGAEAAGDRQEQASETSADDDDDFDAPAFIKSAPARRRPRNGRKT